MDDDYETVQTSVEKGIATVTLDRPDQKNAMNPTLHHEMTEVIYNLKDKVKQGGVRVLVLTGNGDSFCAGQDLKETFLDFESDPEGGKEAAQKAMEWGQELWEFPSPTIAAVNGWAIGGGLRVACTCDLAIASERARFGLSEVNWGIFPGGGSTRVPSRLLNRRDFLYLTLTGDAIDAEMADKMRLVNQTVPHENLMDEVYELAKTISRINPLAVQFAKEVYQREETEDMTYETAIDYELAKVAELRDLQNAEDLRAVQAFKDKKFRPGVEAYRDEDIEEYRNE